MRTITALAFIMFVTTSSVEASDPGPVPDTLKGTDLGANKKKARKGGMHVTHKRSPRASTKKSAEKEGDQVLGARLDPSPPPAPLDAAMIDALADVVSAKDKLLADTQKVSNSARKAEIEALGKKVTEIQDQLTRRDYELGAAMRRAIEKIRGGSSPPL